MGSFSWCRAETTTKRSNISYGDKYKILVPEKFGGGYIKDIYFDYGEIFTEYAEEKDPGYAMYIDGGGNIYLASNFVCGDLYGILAWWNLPDNLDFCLPENTVISGNLESYRPKTMYDILSRGCLYLNRNIGIDIGCYDDQIDELIYPLKLVSASYKGTYESCNGRSYGDPNQGFMKCSWDMPSYQRVRDRLN